MLLISIRFCPYPCRIHLSPFPRIRRRHHSAMQHAHWCWECRNLLQHSGFQCWSRNWENTMWDKKEENAGLWKYRSWEKEREAAVSKMQKKWRWNEFTDIRREDSWLDDIYLHGSGFHRIIKMSKLDHSDRGGMWKPQLVLCDKPERWVNWGNIGGWGIGGISFRHQWESNSHVGAKRRDWNLCILASAR